MAGAKKAINAMQVQVLRECATCTINLHLMLAILFVSTRMQALQINIAVISLLMENVKCTINLYLMLAIMFIATRMRALQINTAASSRCSRS